MRVIGRIFASLFALVFILTMPVALILYNAQASLISADTYKSVLVDQKIYDQAPQVAAGELMNYAATSQDPNDPTAKLVKALTPDEIAKAISVALPTATLQPVVENLIDQAFAIINTRTGTITASTVELKKAIQANGVAALHSIIDTKPVCTAQQISDLNKGDVSVSQPPKENIAEVDAQVSKMLVSITSEFPDNMQLVSEENLAGMQDSLNYLSTAKNAATASIIVPILALTLIALFTVRSKRGWMRWWGIPLLIAGLLALAINKSASLLAGDAVKEQIATSGFTATTNDFLFQLYSGISDSVLSPMFIQSVLAVIIGLALIIGVRWLPEPDEAD